MPNWTYLAVALFYNLGLAIWIGGGIALGALTAPTLFRTIPDRSMAGGAFGSILRKFARLRLLALTLVLGAALTKHLAWERHAAGPWIPIRWIAIVVMALQLCYEILVLETAIERAHGPGGGGSEGFQRLHRRAGLLMKLGIGAAVVALFFN